MITEEQKRKLFLLQDAIEKEIGIKVEIDRDRGSLSGFKAKPDEIKQVKKIIADFFERDRGEPEVYSFRQWESKDQNRRSKEYDQYELDLEPDLEPDLD